MSIEVMKQALEALEDRHMAEDQTPQGKAITALRTAIAEAEKKGPVAWQGLSDKERQDIYEEHRPYIGIMFTVIEERLREKNGGQNKQ